MIEKGTLLKCKTTTLNDMFGTVIWEVVDTGLPAPERERAGQMDGVKVVMLGGSGDKARAGMTLIDSVFHIEEDIGKKITEIVSRSKCNDFLKSIASKSVPGRKIGIGAIEVD